MEINSSQCLCKKGTTVSLYTCSYSLLDNAYTTVKQRSVFWLQLLVHSDQNVIIISQSLVSRSYISSNDLHNNYVSIILHVARVSKKNRCLHSCSAELYIQQNQQAYPLKYICTSKSNVGIELMKIN